MDNAEVIAKEAVQGAEAAKLHEWRQPDPIIKTLPAVVPLPEAILPESMRTWIIDEAARMNCPIDFVAIPALVLAGSLIGNRCNIQPKKNDIGWLLPANLWGGIIGRPSVLKSPAKNAAFRPLKPLEASAMVEHEQNVKQFRAQEASYKATAEAIKADMKNVASSRKKPKPTDSMLQLEAKLTALEEPVQKPLKRYRTSDSTIEKLADLQNESPNGLLVDRDELVGLLANFDKDGREGDRAFYLEGWNGNGSYTVDRIKRGTTIIEKLCISVFGTTQPNKLQKYIYRASHQFENDGLLQRFQLLVYPDTPEPKLVDRAADEAAYQEVEAIYKRLATESPDEWGASEVGGGYVLGFTTDGYDVFCEWYESLTQILTREDDPLLQEHFGKYRSLMPKLALIFHVLEGERSDVGDSCARKAAAWCAYLESHARRIYSLGRNAEADAALFITRKLAKGELVDGFTVRDIRQKGWALLRDNKAIEAALELLVDAGWIHPKPIDLTAIGRPTARYSINPHIGGKHEPLAK
jgi:hypothetical protein